MASFLTSQEIQELINVDRSTVYRMAEDGRLPGVKVGRQWRFPADRVAERFGLELPPSNRSSQSSPSGQPSQTRGNTDASDLRQLLEPGVAESIAELVGELFGLMTVITDLSGQPISPVANPCGYYSALDGPGAVEACVQQWQLFAGEPHVAPRWVRTHLGFLCARTFLWVDLKPVGMIVVGGVRPPVWPPPPEDIDRIASEIGVPSAVLHDAVEDLWEIDIAEQRRVLRLLPQMGDLISQLATAHSALASLDHRQIADNLLQTPSVAGREPT